MREGRAQGKTREADRQIQGVAASQSRDQGWNPGRNWSWGRGLD